MSSISCFVWFVGMAALTGFFAWLTMWSLHNGDEFFKGLVISLCAAAGVTSFIFAIGFLAGAVG